MGMNSVTLVSDGFHNFADAGGFAIAILASWAQDTAKDEAKAERIGLIGGFTNCSITMILTFCAGVEAFRRLFVSPHTSEDPHIGPMYFACAILGMCINGFGAIFLGGHGHSHGGVPCKAHGSPAPSLTEVLPVSSADVLSSAQSRVHTGIGWFYFFPVTLAAWQLRCCISRALTLLPFISLSLTLTRPRPAGCRRRGVEIAAGSRAP